MQILRTLIAGAVAAAHTWPGSLLLDNAARAQGVRPFGVRPTRSESVLVKAVTDGDTITVSTFGRVRLLGIDAPETSHGLDTAAPFGREARDYLTRLLLHRWVRLESEGQTLDIYNRHLAYVMTEDGQCVNTILVREGLARVSARESLSRLDELKRAEVEAQRFRRGMWGSPPPAQTTGYTRGSGARRSPAPKTSPPTKGARKKKSP